MKKMFLFLAVASVLLTGCTDKNAPSNGVTVNFSIQKIGPLMYKFTNLSQGADSYKWDFGDGSFSYANDEAIYTYSEPGTYIVTLTGIKGDEKTDCRKNLTVKKPSIYIAGYTLYRIPYENKYYKIVCKDDDVFATNWGFTTAYTPLLDGTDMPYVKYFSSPKLMDKLDGDNYYTFYVYHTTNTSSTSGDTQCLKQRLTKDAIYTYQAEHILKSNNGETEIGILFQYD